MVDIFICQVNAAGKGNLAVNDQDLPVIPVVVVGRDDRGDGAEHLAADAKGLHFLGIAFRKGGELAGAVIQQPHIHTLSDLPLQNLQHLAPHEALPEDEVFQVDIVPRLFQFQEHPRPLVFSLGKIGDPSVGIDRKVAAGMDVLGQSCRAGILLPQIVQNALFLPDQVMGKNLAAVNQGLQGPAAPFALGPYI